MKITLLGTGSSTGTPMIGCDCKVCTSEDSRNQRTRFSILIETGLKNILIDVPFEIRLQLLKTGISSMDAIWLTHYHSDHIAGIDDLRIFSFRKNAPLTLFATKECIAHVQSRFPYLFFENDYMEYAFLTPHLIEDKPQFFHGIEFFPIFHTHGDMIVVSFRIGNFAFLADLSSISDSEKEKLKNLDLLIIACTVKTTHQKHMGLDDVLQLIKEINPKRAVLTHMNHRFDYTETAATLPEGVIPGYDGLSFTI